MLSAFLVSPLKNPLSLSSLPLLLPLTPLPLFLRTPKPPLRRFRRKNDFGVSDALYAGSICCPRIEDSFFSGSVDE